MAEKKIQWTDQQRQAITARGSDVLVTASAGTGKTSVLSGRCVDIITEKIDVRNMLVLTFTEAAAEEMRSRIAEQLKRETLENPDGHLRYQLILLQGSDISTIHSFCKRLITEHFYKLGLDPTFRVIDGDEQKLLKAEVLEKTIDQAWQEDNIRSALEILLKRRDLKEGGGFLSKIIQFSDFLDGIVSRQNWYERAAKLADITSVISGDLAEKQKKLVLKRLRDIYSRMQYAVDLYERENQKGKWLEKWKEPFIKPIEDYINLIDNGRWDEFVDSLKTFQRPKKYEYKPRNFSGISAEIIKAQCKAAKESFESLFDLAILNPDYLKIIAGSAGLQTKVIAELVKRFDINYSRAKEAINCLDFADLEHYALNLLTGEDSTEDNPLPSETALSLQQKYKHLFVDEYQDINSVQQRILQMLSPGGNILHVGDVKQSIYAFRGAEPDIFIEQLKQVSVVRQSMAGDLRVDLNTNFRSVKGILDFVNSIFSRIMISDFAGIDYDEAAQLRPAAIETTEKPGKVAVEFHLLDEADKSEESHQGQDSDEDETNYVTSRRRQAMMIADRIRRMVGAGTSDAEFQIFDKETNSKRDVRYSDIVILMRSLAQKANDYVEVLQLAGVPVSCQATAGYFQATEISDILALLKVLDNPLRDIELAAVLRSSFFKISDTELAKIRIHNNSNRQMGYFECILKYSDNGNDPKLAGRLGEIIQKLQQWRSIARRGNLADMIWRIYRETGFLSFVTALPNGRTRRANLLKLHDRAIQFEGFIGGSGIPTLKRFVEFFEKLIEAGQDWAPAEPHTSASNAVRILSVHKSKGLEFPVVFLAGLESPFNKKDIYADCLINAEDTLGLQVIDSTSNRKIRSLAHEVIAEQKLSTALAEEMRILYVATTRAKDKLVLVASEKNNKCGRIISNGLMFGEKTIPDWQLHDCTNPLEWILYGLSEQKSLHEAFETDLAEQSIEDNLFSFKIYGYAELKNFSEFIIKHKSGRLKPPSIQKENAASEKTESDLLVKIKDTLEWEYQFADSPELPAKTSVTALTHRDDEYSVASHEIRDTKYDRRELGIATHLLISKLDLTEAVTYESIEEVKEKLVEDNAAAADIAQQIDTQSILAFIDSPQGKLALDKKNKIHREWPFTFSLLVSQWKKLSSLNQNPDKLQDTIIVQGIIDMLIQTPEGLVIIDFKTDRISKEQSNQRAELYRRQLELYGRAAEAILKTRVTAKWLYFLTPAVSIGI